MFIGNRQSTRSHQFIRVEKRSDALDSENALLSAIDGETDAMSDAFKRAGMNLKKSVTVTPFATEPARLLLTRAFPVTSIPDPTAHGLGLFLFRKCRYRCISIMATKYEKRSFLRRNMARFLPLTKTIPKEIVPIMDKPIIHYIVEEAARIRNRRDHFGNQ